jgi:hypothetical protein
MGWGNGHRNSGITRIFNYEQALTQFNDTKPIRGRAIECRPLGHRDRPHFSIKLNEQQEVECCDYNAKPAVTFRPNGEVWIRPQWISTSTCAFIEEVLGIGSYQSDWKIQIRLNCGTYVVPKEAGLVVKRGDAPNYHYAPMEIKRNVVHHIKRGVANNVRLQYEDVFSYAHGYFKLDAKMPSDEEQREMFGIKQIVNEYADGERYEYDVLNNPRWEISNPEDFEQFIDMMRSDEPMDKYKAIVALRISGGSWRSEKRTYENVIQVIDRMILAMHRDEVFKEVEVPVGVVKKDIYGWAFE